MLFIDDNINGLKLKISAGYLLLTGRRCQAKYTRVWFNIKYFILVAWEYLFDDIKRIVAHL